MAKTEQNVLVLQGGGALGAYQAGASERLAEAAFPVDWVAGISIGAINAAIICGNPPEKRIERLRSFWERVSSALDVTPWLWGHEIPTLLCGIRRRRSHGSWVRRDFSGHGCRWRSGPLARRSR